MRLNLMAILIIIAIVINVYREEVREGLDRLFNRQTEEKEQQTEASSSVDKEKLKGSVRSYFGDWASRQSKAQAIWAEKFDTTKWYTKDALDYIMSSGADAKTAMDELKSYVGSWAKSKGLPMPS